MKLLTNNIISYIFIMLIGISGYAKNSPPAPTQKGAQTLAPDPPKVPIDSNIILLTLAGTLFGLYTIHKHKTKKRPV